jgi:undecaprenyl-diphosphatase
VIDDILKAAILGTLQGITEFLPVSSTGHLIIAEDWLGVDDKEYGLAFDAALHVGTLIALLAYFGGRWLTLVRAAGAALLRREHDPPEARLAWLIVAGTVPAAVLGLAFEDQIEETLRSPVLVAAMLISFSGVFAFAERRGAHTRRIGSLTLVDTIAIGCAQAVALVPGVSRSGATISAGLLRRVERRDAATFAFLLSAPIVAAAGLRGFAGALRDFANGTLGRDEAVFFMVGMTCAAGVGYLSIALLLRFLATNSLIPFAIYRVALGVAVICVLLAGAV